MKSLRLFLCLSLSGLLVFSGCLGLFGEKSEEVPLDTYEFATYEGTLQSLGTIKFNPDATHLLRLEDGTVLYVYSDFYNLWDPEFLNQRMEVSGLLIPENEEVNKDTLAIEQLEVLEIEEEETVIIRMENYVDEILGFAMDYRSDWTISNDPSSLTFTAPEPEVEGDEVTEDMVFDLDTVMVSTFRNAEELEIEEWFVEYRADIEPLYSLSVVSADQLPAIKVMGDGITYYIDGGSTVFVVAFDNLQFDKRTEHTNLFNEMLFSFDVLRDGVREPVIEEETIEEEMIEEETIEIVEPDVAPDDQGSVITSIESQLDNLVPDAGDWTATKYDFVEPDYIYVEYADDDAVGRILVRDLGGGDFEVLAVFKEGFFTDWSLVSGTDEAKGKEKTSVDASSGQAVTILEGYRALESATLHFQMQYPSSWYYSRSGDHFYFSNEPADASNALVVLTVLDSPITLYTEQASGDTFTIEAPRDESSGYTLTGDAAYQDHMTIMAESIVSTEG